MKKKAGIMLAVLWLTGCGNELYDQSMEQGKLALAGGDFDKALASFELALEEKPDDTEVRALYSQLTAYQDVEEAIEQGHWDDAVQKGDDLLKEQKLEVRLQKSLNQLIQMAESAQKNEQAVSAKVETLQKLADEKKYEEAEELINSLKQDNQLEAAYANVSDQIDKIATDIQSGRQSEAEAEKAAAVQAAREAAEQADQQTVYYQKLDRIERGNADLDAVYENGTTVEIREAETERYKRWDDALNEIYGVLKNELPAAEMAQLRQEQREWIAFRDEAAEEAASQFEGGTWESVQFVSSQANLTKERCYQLVDLYMK